MENVTDELVKVMRYDNKVSYYRKHIDIINLIIGIDNKQWLTNFECRILTCFLDLGIVDSGLDVSVYYKLVRSKLDLSPASLSNSVRKLKAKGWINKRGYISMLLYPSSSTQLYKIALVYVDEV